MQIIKEQFQTKIVGKCIEKEDILQLWKFGFSIESIAKKYAKDNNLKITDSKKIVIDFLYNEVINENTRNNNKRCNSEQRNS